MSDAAEAGKRAAVSYVSVSDMWFRYAPRRPPVIAGLSFSVRKGEMVGIVGPSGSGKSTVLRLLAGLEEPERGRIAIDGMVVADERSVVAPEKRGVGLVFQDYALFPHLNAENNIAFGLHRLRRGRRAERTAEMLELVQLTEFAKRYPHELSGGQQQRVVLARALAPEPALLLLDEPFSNLDAGLRGAIRSELEVILRKAAITCIIVSHDEADIEAICDRVIAIGTTPAETVGGRR